MLQAAVLILAALLPRSGALAQWSTDPNVNNPICTTPSRYRSDLKMTSDGAGGAFLTWTGQTSPAGLPGVSLDVYAQRIDSSGLLPWGIEEAVIANSRLVECAPAITANGAGGASIVWGVRNTNQRPSSLYFAQRMDANGNQLWAQGGEYISAGGLGLDVINSGREASASDGMGGIFIVYNGGAGAFATCIKASGDVPTQLDQRQILTGTMLSRSLAIVSDGVGGAIVAMKNDANSNLYLQRVDSSGMLPWGVNGVTIVSGGSLLSFPLIMSDGAGGAIASWLDSRTSFGVYAQRVDSAGVVQWASGGVPIISGASIRLFSECWAMSTDGSGGAIVAWHDTSTGLKVQRVNNAGVLQWDSSGVAIAQTLPSSVIPAILSDNAGGAIITWSDARNGASNTDIYAQRVDSSGGVQWTPNGVAISTASGNQTAPQIVTNGAGDAIIAWLDLRNAGPSFQPAEIYGQRVNANGQLGGITDAPDNDLGIPVAFKLNQSYPNPFNPTTTFTFSIPRTGNVLLSIYNVLGQEVATVVDETLAAGNYSRTFNAAGLASGAYFYRLNAGGFSETKRMLLVK
jgi:hypothetical protein